MQKPIAIRKKRWKQRVWVGGAMISGFFFILGVLCIIAGIAFSVSGAEAGYPSLVLVLVVLGGFSLLWVLSLRLEGKR
jgi:VIT1/CCC1 family predicted Fe2+/Mn2+ transporter